MSDTKLATRDAMAKVLCPPHHREGFGGTITNADGTTRSVGGEWRPCLLHASQAGALLASGVVRDPATLADDEALVERVGAVAFPTSHGIHGRVDTRRVLIALAAALTADPS